MANSFDIKLLEKQHKRANFTCGVAELDDYFHKYVGQDIRKHVTKCYVAVDISNNMIAGYYTLSASGINLEDVPDSLKKHLPRYSVIPAALLGRLAISQSYQGQKLGAALLVDAIERVKEAPLGVSVLIVDAKNDNAKSFYLHHDFVSLASIPLRLVLLIR
jgi:ribosomal protein S18 acetylase RimI-like enzyme